MAARKRKKSAYKSKSYSRGYLAGKRKKRAAGKKKDILDKVLSILK